MKTLWIVIISVWLLAFAAGCGPAADRSATGGPAVSDAALLPQEVATAMADHDGAYVVLTLPGTLDTEREQQLREAGIRLFDPLGENRFQAYVPQTAVSDLSALKSSDLIVDLSPIEPASKIKGKFRNLQQTYGIVVHFYEALTESETAVLSDHMIVDNTAVGAMNFIEGRATGEQIQQMSELPFVKLIEPITRNSSGEADS